MAYARIERHTWHDDVFRQLSADARLAWLYLLSCPHGNRLGCFVLHPFYAAADLNVSPATVEAALQELADAKLIAWSPDVHLVMLLRFLRHNKLENPNVAKAALQELNALPFDATILGLLSDALERWGESFYERLTKRLAERLEEWFAKSKPLPEPVPNQREDAKASLSSSDEPNVDRAEQNGGSPEPVQELFEYWRDRSGHSHAKLTTERRAKIRARLKRFRPDELRRAIDGACANPFYTGDNDRSQRYDFPETIFKNDAAVDRHMSYTPNGNGGGLVSAGRVSAEEQGWREVNEFLRNETFE